MIHVIAVDDEPPALRRVGALLQTFDEVQVAGLFESGQLFLDHVLTMPGPIDLALLDMELPGMNGLELARRLRAVRPEIQIAFLTAYEEYARDAFDVEAIDYLLKPIAREDLARTLDRCQKRSSRIMQQAQPERGISVSSFGPFSVTTEAGETVRFRNSKSRELLAYLHYHGGRPVSKVKIMDDLWYGRDAARTQVNLHSTVYQLRKDLEAAGLPRVLEQSKTAGGSYQISWNVAFDDLAAYEEECRLYRQTLSITHVMRAIQLYGDGYLEGSGYGWAAPRQAELELGYAGLLEVMVDTYVRQKRFDIALKPLQKWVRLQPLEVRLHGKMIALLLLMDREADAISYHRLALELLELEDTPHMLDLPGLRVDPFAMF
ncbi:response regulator [Paenibacillus thalictri]|uniref:response regulator n=1 Tax=Paenibacillus thalictri TaxID=2527873 RepID=UPI0013EF545A|nr:response regulator [Paenibacillus thalictri]